MEDIRFLQLAKGLYREGAVEVATHDAAGTSAIRTVFLADGNLITRVEGPSLHSDLMRRHLDRLGLFCDNLKRIRKRLAGIFRMGRFAGSLLTVACCWHGADAGDRLSWILAFFGIATGGIVFFLREIAMWAGNRYLRHRLRHA